MTSSKPNEWVLLRAYSSSLEANVVRSFLNSKGIETRSRDEHIVNINWLYSNAVGGVKVMVAAGELDRAKALLEEQEGQPNLEVVGMPCPKCSSLKTERSFHLRRGVAGLVMALLSVVLPLSQSEKWSCEECGYQWEERDPVTGVFGFVNWLLFVVLSVFLAAAVYYKIW